MERKWPTKKSGCCINKFNLLLTIKELERLHKARWRKEKRKLVMTKMSKEEEAIERAKIRKQGGAIVPLVMGLSKCHNFSIINDEKDDDEEMPQTFIVINIRKDWVLNFVFIDSRKDSNTIPYEFFKQLKNLKI